MEYISFGEHKGISIEACRYQYKHSGEWDTHMSLELRGNTYNMFEGDDNHKVMRQACCDFIDDFGKGTLDRWVGNPVKHTGSYSINVRRR